ncbi:ABC transporter ATP-binding protein [Nocardioides sp. Root79]|nr:ABC transporter ATP-binding protein [Nocardioides sp. Root79]KRC72033.1 ABC transporter ATP-binding protein [Nocardioides sp. Root240]
MTGRSPRVKHVTTALAALLASAGLLVPASPAHAADPFTTTTLHFKVAVGPTGSTACDVVGDVYVPAAASSASRVPAVLTTNGFGGSKDDQATFARTLASRGYVVLSYSGLGFGGSSCVITLDDPDYDGKAASQLVSYLGGRGGIAFLDKEHTQPAPVLDVVQKDAHDHKGVARTDDPRVGTFGGSYGGGFQFAVASVDARVDAIVPLITWNDLSYSLDPNNTAQATGVSSATPGAAKLLWALGFSVTGVLGELQNQQVPPDALPCPNFAAFVCPALVTAGATGFLLPSQVASLRHASVASYVGRVRVPTLLIQGERDTLFNLNEATATYRALQAQGTETKMIWMLGGHSGDGAPGEVTWADPASGYVSGRVLGWFERYLRGGTGSTGPEFAYFRDWVSYAGNAAPAYATSTSFPVGVRRTWRLSGKGDLVTGLTPTAAGSQSLVTTAAGLPTRLDEMDVFGSYFGPVGSLVTDLPGTAVGWSTPALTAPVRVAGSPTVTLRVGAPSAALTQATCPAGQLVLFVKVADVAPDGTARLINGLEAPVRIPDVTKAFTVQVPAIVHEFAAGHRIRLVVAGGSVNYRGGLAPTPVTIASGSAQTLSLPVVP